MENDKILRIKELVKLLNNASDAYYNTDKPIISDSEFDKLFDELKQLENETGFIMSNSVTQNVGFEVKSKLEKVEHSIPLKSLGKTKNIKEVEKFIGNKEVLLMLKGDGLTCELIYNNGELIQGSTRGNSIIGEDITHNVRTFKNIPLQIDFKGYLKLAGEAIISNKDFEIVNSKLKEEDKYSNSRNLVAGSVRQLDSSICAKRNVNFMAFTLLECEGKDFETLEEQFEFLNNLGFEIIFFVEYNNNQYSSLQDNIDDLKQYAKYQCIPIDGEVIAYNNLKYAESLGETEHHPLGKLALKFADDEYETKYIKTEWQVSRTSMINPVGVFQPTDMDGSVVERATLHNIDYFEALQLGKDDIITIAKQNMVIPKILNNKTRSNTEVIPKECPICGSKTEIRLQKTARFLYCTNDNCPSKKVAQFEHFCSRDAMNIMGVSEAICEEFINKGFLKTIPNLYRLEQYKNQIIKMSGYGLKSYNKIIEGINSSKHCKLANFLFALGIPTIGKGTAKDIATYFKNSIDDFIDAIGSWFDFSTIKDIGEVTNNAIYEWFKNDENINIISELIRILEFEEDKPKTVQSDNQVFSGQKIYCTGSFASHKKEELKTIVENKGGEFANGYAKSLSMLVVGSLKGSSKEDKAKKDGIKIVYEDEFLKMIGE